MKKIFLFCMPFILSLVTYNNFAQSVKESMHFAFITAINTTEKNIIIDADFVQMLYGNAAIKAAKKAGEAEYDTKGKGDTTWYVPNDYFILNENPQLRNLPVANTVAVYLVKEGKSQISKSNIASLKKSFEGKLFRLTISKKSIIKITEIYTP